MAQRDLQQSATEADSVPQTTHLSEDELSESYNGFESDVSGEKDETELELEKLVFGDDAGFRAGLSTNRSRSFARHCEAEGAENIHLQAGPEPEDGFEGVDDANLFFFDSVPLSIGDSDLIPNPKNDNQSNEAEEGAQAWTDSDDERIVVSLASNPRLRKLRFTEAEDLVDGREYTKRLRQQFQRLYPVPEWADPLSREKIRKRRRRRSENSVSSESDGQASDMSFEPEELSAQPLTKLMRNTMSIVDTTTSARSTGQKLRPEVIDIQRTKDVGDAQPSAITSLAFHPIHPLLLSSGPSSMLSLHHISPHPPAPNPLLTSLHLRHTPLYTSRFLPPSGSKIFFSARRRFFHVWDLSTGRVERVSRMYGHKDQQKSMERFKLSPCGRWMGLIGTERKGGGVINVLNAHTGQWLAEARIEGVGGVADFGWWGDGEGMCVLGKGGEAVEWDGREKRVVARWVDEGAVGTTVMAIGGRKAGPARLGGDRWVAVGSSSGIVNVYDRRTWDKSVPERPRPLRAFDQLVTSTSHLEFSMDGQLLCMASRWKRDALRLIHLPSCTVYRNWPTAGTPLGRVSSVAWSSGGDFLAVGNEQGKIRLWEIRN